MKRQFDTSTVPLAEENVIHETTRNKHETSPRFVLFRVLSWIKSFRFLMSN